MNVRSRRVVLACVVGVALPILASCSSASTLGNYAVTGTISTNTCGAGLGAPSPWSFTVQLSQNGSTMYWNALDGSPLSYGPVSGSTANLSGSTAGADSTADGSAGACAMSRLDAVVLDLTGSPPTSFTGTLTYTFDVEPGADCSDQAGTYATLPCSLGYALTATRQ
jgi:hypothetical protein